MMGFQWNSLKSLVVQEKVSKFLNNNDPIFYLPRQKLPKNELIYLSLGVLFFFFFFFFFFSNDLELKSDHIENE